MRAPYRQLFLGGSLSQGEQLGEVHGVPWVCGAHLTERFERRQRDGGAERHLGRQL